MIGQAAATEKLHDMLQHHPGTQQQHLAQQARERAEHKQASVSAQTPAGEIVVKDEAEKRGGDRRSHHDDTPRDVEKKNSDIPEVEEGRIIDIKI